MSTKNMGCLKPAVVGSIVATAGMAFAFNTDVVMASGNGDAAGAYAQATKVFANAKFKDVKADEYYYDAVNWAYEQGIINGYSNGTIFKPNDQVTEAQFVKMLSNYLNLEGSYKSVNQGTHWSNDLYNTNLMYQAPLNGYKDMQLRNAPIKRGTVAQLISHYLSGDSKLDPSIIYLLNNDITTGQNSSTSDLRDYFGSNNTLTRAQAVTFLYRMENKGLNRPAEGFDNIIEMSLMLSADDLYEMSCGSLDGSLLTDKACKAPDATTPSPEPVPNPTPAPPVPTPKPPTTDNGSAVDADLHPVAKEMFADPLKKALDGVSKSNLYDTLIEAYIDFGDKDVGGMVEVKGDTVIITFLAVKGSQHDNVMDIRLTKTSIKISMTMLGHNSYSNKYKYGLEPITDLDYKYINKLLGITEKQIKNFNSYTGLDNKGIDGMTRKSADGITFEANYQNSYVSWKKGR